MAKVRIKDLVETTTVENSDYLATDSPNGTKKVSKENFMKEVIQARVDVKDPVTTHKDLRTRLNNDYQKIDADQTTQNNRLANLENRANALETDNTQNKADIVVLKQDSADFKQHMAEKDYAVTQLQNKVSTLETDASQHGQDIANIQAELQTKETKIANLESKVSALEGRVAILETAKSDLETRIATLETANSDKETRITDLETAQSDLETRITDLETAKSDLETRITDLETANTNIQSEIDAIKAHVGM